MGVRGYANWTPKADAAFWIQATRRVLDEYKDYWPLTVRQIFYRLVAESDYEKTESAYNKLTGIISRARRAGFIPWDAIRDGGQGKGIDPNYFAGQDHFERSILAAARDMHLDRQRDQEMVIELWCEAGGMVPILEGIAEPYSARVNSGGGYDSVTAKHRLAERVRDRAKKGLRTLILHVGDFDASGEDMANVLREDAMSMAVSQVLQHVDGPDWLQEERESAADTWSREAIRWAAEFFDVQRVALTAKQVVDRQVITAPPKPSDSRTVKFVQRNAWVMEELGTPHITAQLEALTPPELEALISGVILDTMDRDTYEAVLAEEEQVRADLVARLGRPDA